MNHDALVRRALGDPVTARAWLQARLPEDMAQHLNFDTLQRVPGSFVDEALKRSETDVLYQSIILLLLDMLAVAKGRCAMTRKVSIDWAPEDTADALHAQYRAEPVAEVRSHRRGGPGKPCFLTPAQQEQVVAEAAQGVFGTAQAVRDWIEEQFGVVYTRDSLYTLLPRLGIRLKVPRPRHAKTAPQAQAAWQKGGSGSVWPRSA